MTDKLFMARCLDLAQKGLGNVSPNPLVGCVIVHDNQIIGEGYHQKYGESHAEVNAINSVKNPELLPYSTLYVNLEPCSHYGKTPPCSDLIIEKKIPEVVIGAVDSSSKVNGRGIKKMEEAGVKVQCGIMEEACQSVNKRFFTFHEKQRPYIILKWASTSDGFMDPERKEEKGSISISGEAANVVNHQWRHEEDAILIGKNTLLIDDPELTTRKVKGKNPVRILLSEKIPESRYKIFQNNSKTFLFNKEKQFSEGDIEYIATDPRNLEAVLNELYQREISSVIVEGGREILRSFINKNLWDEARVITSKQAKFKSGLDAPELESTKMIKEEELPEDFIKYYLNS